MSDDDEDKHENGKGKGHHEHGNGHGYGHYKDKDKDKHDDDDYDDDDDDHDDDDCDDDDDHEVPCFASGSRLTAANGMLVNVEDIEVGMEMRVYDGVDSTVIWVGKSAGDGEMYRIIDATTGIRTLVTKNHGVAVRLLDGSMALAPAKFLTDAVYGDFMVVEERVECDVYHIMLATHELVVADGGMISESYFCGGWSIHPAALDANGGDVHDLRLPRVKRKDADDIAEVVRTDTRTRAARAA